MKNDEDILQALVAGGLIGATLGAIISEKNKGAAASIGAVAGAILLATFKANEAALESGVPLYEEQNGNLYQILPNGERKFIRKIDKPQDLPKTFKIK